MQKLVLLSLTLILISCGNDEDSKPDEQPKSNSTKETELIEKLNENSELMAYFPFNNSAEDESKNRNNGELNNVEITADRFGNEKSAYKFEENKNSFIKIPSFGEVSSFTITAWIKLSSKNNESYNVIVSKSTKSREYVFRQNKKAYGQYLSVHFTEGANGIGGSSFGALKPDIWLHVGMTYNNGKVMLYHNGVKSEEKTVDPIAWNQGDVIIGSFSGSAEFFDGIIDDVLFVNRILTSDEVKILADNK